MDNNFALFNFDHNNMGNKPPSMQEAAYISQGTATPHLNLVEQFSDFLLHQASK